MTGFSYNLAIAIGINNYRNNIAELKTARPDAKKLANLLGTDYNYQVELITDETERKPSLTELRTLLTRWLPQQLQPPAHNNRLLFYFAGHGMSLESDDGPKGFLLPQDADPKDPSTFLPMQELHDALIALPCHHLLIILDCCFAGTFRWSSTRKSIPIPEIIHRQHYDRFLRYPACQVITSSAHNQEALDFLSDKRGTGKDAQHSPFAEALFEALQDGKPDEKGKRYKKADLTKDGVITAPELYLYLRDNVETRSGERQTPGLFPLKKHDRGEYIFHDPNFDPTTLSEAPALDEANNPYRGLKPFEEQHARFFFGRQELIKHLYARIAAPDRSLTVVLGISGSGKSSLVKAGLIPYLRQRSQPEDFAIHLAQACILTTAILYSFARLPRKSWLPPNFLPIDYSHQWQILPPMRPGESPFASLARTLLAIADTPVSPQLNQLDFLNELLEGEDEQLNAEMEQVVNEGKWNSSRAKQLEQKTETLTRIIADWNDASPLVRQRLLVEHFEMLYALCQSGEQESEQQQQLKQTFLACLAPLIQQLQSDPKSLVAIAHTWEQNHSNTKLLLIIDQFEELITLGRTTPQNAQSEQPEEWQQFLRLLETTLAANVPQLHIVVTLRSDFEPRFLSSETLKPYWSKARFPVRAMRSDELRQAIEGPASEMALYFEPVSLVDRLIDEVGQMPGALPLLSFTLSELYMRLYEQWTNDKATDRALTIDAQFDQEGGVAGSLTRRANEEYHKIGDDPNLSEAGQRTMRRIMLRMLTLEGGETARRRVPDSELIYPTQEESDRVKQVLDRLVNARLLVRGQLETGEPYIEPAHDFLVRGWGMLQDWINEEKAKETLELQQRLAAQANDWERSGRSNGLLLPDGDRLNQFERILQKLDHWLNQREIQFIENSLKQVRRLQSRTKLPQKAGRVHDLLASDPRGGLTLAIQAMGENLDDLPGEILSSVQGSLQIAMEIGKEVVVLEGHEEIINSVAISRDGRMVVSGADKTVRLWHLQEKLIEISLQNNKQIVKAVDISPNGQMIVGGRGDKTIRLWKLDGTPIGQPFQGHKGGVTSVTFSPDGQVIVSGSNDKTIRLWRLDGTSVGQPFQGHKGGVTSVTFSPDGQVIASSGDMDIRLWKSDGTAVGEPFQGHKDIVNSIAFSPDGQLIISGSNDKTIQLWELQGKLIGNPYKGHDGYVNQHKDAVTSVAFNPDGKSIISGSRDGTIRLWDLTSSFIVQPLKEYEEGITSVAFSSDGQVVSSGSKTVWLWHLQNRSIKTLFVHKDIQEFYDTEGNISYLGRIYITPDGKTIITCEFEHGSPTVTVRLWDLSGNPITPPLQGHERGIRSVVFDPVCKRILTASADSILRLWDFEGNLVQKPFQAHKSVVLVALSQDGQMIISCGRDQFGSGSTLRLWSLQGEPIGQPFYEHERDEDFVTSIVFSPKASIYATSSSDRTLRLWDLQGKSIGQPFYGHKEAINSVAFSPDGQMIVSGSSDKTVRLWRGSWNLWLRVCCDRLRYHPVFTNPESIEDPEQREIAITAYKTCEKYVWSKTE